MHRAIAVPATLFLASCSTAWHRLPATIVSPGRTAAADLWVRADTREQPVSVVTDTILFPLDALFSLLAAVAALPDDRVDIEAGPGGMLLAMLLPFVTATYDPDVDTIEEMQAGKELPYHNAAPVRIPMSAAHWNAWQRGEQTLVDAAAAAEPHGWMAAGLRRGDVVIEVLDSGQD